MNTLFLSISLLIGGRPCLIIDGPAYDSPVVPFAVDSARVIVESLSVERAISDMAGVLRKLGKADSLAWGNLTDDVLGFGERFPTVTGWQVRNPTSNLLAIYQRYNPAALPSYLNALQKSPNAAQREFGMSQVVLERARHTPFVLRFTALDGRDIDIASMRGRVVLIDIWSTTCSSCVAELPGIKHVYELYHEQGFEVIGIAIEEDDSRRVALRRFVLDRELPWPQKFEANSMDDNAIERRFGLVGVPQTILLDKNGFVVAIGSQARGASLEPLVRTVLELPVFTK